MKQIFNSSVSTIGRSGVVVKFFLSTFLLLSWFSVFPKEYKVDTSTSTLEWNAKKVTGQHSGKVSFTEGVLNLEKGKIAGGKFVADMNSIVDTDLTDPGFNQKLIGHLKSDDFFGVAKFPQALLEVKKAEAKSDGLYHFTADLTIKGITAPVEFDAEVTDATGQLTATGVMTVNRTKYGIKYGSGSFFEGLGDKMIYDDFTIKFKLVATAN